MPARTLQCGAGDLREPRALGMAVALPALTRNDVGAARGGVAVAALLRAFGIERAPAGGGACQHAPYLAGPGNGSGRRRPLPTTTRRTESTRAAIGKAPACGALRRTVGCVLARTTPAHGPPPPGQPALPPQRNDHAKTIPLPLGTAIEDAGSPGPQRCRVRARTHRIRRPKNRQIRLPFPGHTPTPWRRFQRAPSTGPGGDAGQDR